MLLWWPDVLNDLNAQKAEIKSPFSAEKGMKIEDAAAKQSASYGSLAETPTKRCSKPTFDETAFGRKDGFQKLFY
jgi:hypothetical protein